MNNTLKIFIKSVLSRYLSIKTKSKIMKKVNLNFTTKLEGNNIIHKGANIANSEIGYGSYIGPNSALFNTKIGKYCSISENVNIAAGSHPTKKFVSTHPSFFSTLKQSGFTYVKENKFTELHYADNMNKYFVTIGSDVWIAANVTILHGNNVGDGVIIATGAVVTRDLEPYCIYGGVPAKKIGQRFSDEQIKFLISFKWWDKTKEWIMQSANLFEDIDEFIKVVKENEAKSI